jgi:hypothetical protein
MQWIALGIVLMLVCIALFAMASATEVPDIRPTAVPKIRPPKASTQRLDVPVAVSDPDHVKTVDNAGASAAPTAEPKTAQSPLGPLAAALGGFGGGGEFGKDEEDEEDMETVQASAEEIAKIRAEMDRRSEVED